jgi:hypothetical protein
MVNNSSTLTQITTTQPPNGLLSSTKSSVFRFKFTFDFSTELSRFSKNHQYDDRKIFKEEFNKWVIDNQKLVEDEIEYLQTNGYSGDMKTKIFISSRFYYRKKEQTSETEIQQQPKQPRQKKEYVPLNKEYIHQIDHYINGLNTDTNRVAIIKPEEGFESFCKNCSGLLKIIIQFYLDKDKTSIQNPEDMKKRVKKLFKNRYYIIHNNNN